MKHKKKHVFLKILLSIMAALGFFVLVLWINGTCKYRKHYAEESWSSWMEEIDDDVLLREIVIPGSHDAGTVGLPWPGRTQNYSIGEQLAFGARYFDIRVNQTKKGYPIYHAFMNGKDFREVLSEIQTFIVAHPTEVLLLDFQHFKGGSKEAVYQFLTDELEKEGLVLHNDSGKSDLEFIHSLTLGEARGKCIIFFGETDEDFSDWVFLRNNDDCSKENMTLDSYYLGDCHKGGFEALTEKAHPVYFELLRAKQEKGENGIFVLQCQLTDGKLIFGPWSVERGQEKKMWKYVENLKNSTDFQGVNVIMRDFLIPEKCQEIIELNEAKNF